MPPQPPPFATTATLTCLCGKTISGEVAQAASWEQQADLAERHGWLPVLKGDVVGAAGAVRYACSTRCQTTWIERL
jgi:hypothetical protein